MNKIIDFVTGVPGASKTFSRLNIANQYNESPSRLGVIIGLIGGCQEINTGEAGLSGWILVLKIHLLADLLFKLFKYRA